MSTLTVDHLREAKRKIAALGPIAPRLEVIVMDAQRQARTPRDVVGPWVRPQVPSKAKGRKGTRRGWKRRNPPHHLMFFREPEDVLHMQSLGRAMVIVTPRQKVALDAATVERNARDPLAAFRSGNLW